MQNTKTLSPDNTGPLAPSVALDESDVWSRRLMVFSILLWKLKLKKKNPIRLPTPDFRKRREDTVFEFFSKQLPHLKGARHFVIFTIPKVRARSLVSCVSLGNTFQRIRNLKSDKQNLQRSESGHRRSVSTASMPTVLKFFTCRRNLALDRSSKVFKSDPWKDGFGRSHLA